MTDASGNNNENELPQTRATAGTAPPTGAARKNATIHNPYIKRASAATMGLQSQHRQSSLRQLKKAAAARNKAKAKSNGGKGLVQVGLPGRKAFIALRDCKVCKLTQWRKEGRRYPRNHKKAGQLMIVPHRGHHWRCELNRSTRGKSARWVEVERIAEANIRANNIPPASLGCSSGTTAAFKGAFLKVAPPTLPGAVADALQNNVEPPDEVPMGVESPGETPNGANTASPDALALELRLELERRLEALGNDTSGITRLSKLVAQCSAPPAIALLFDYISSETIVKFANDCNTETRRVAFANSLEKRHRFFPGDTAFFTFPRDALSPNPHPRYHAIEGCKIFILDWEAQNPGVKLFCPCCNSQLQRLRTNFSHHKTLFPIFPTNGIPMWGSYMVYKCFSCRVQFTGNSSSILAGLPPYIANQYPVEVRYAATNMRFHLSIDSTDELESRILSVASGESYSKKLFRCQGKQYERVTYTYASKAGSGAKDFDVPLEEFVGKFAPSGHQLRCYYQDGDSNPLTPYGYSNEERYTPVHCDWGNLIGMEGAIATQKLSL